MVTKPQCHVQMSLRSNATHGKTERFMLHKNNTYFASIKQTSEIRVYCFASTEQRNTTQQT